MADYLFDSNALIYSASPIAEYDNLRGLLIQPGGAASAISQIEVLGFSGLALADRSYLEAAFEVLEIISVSTSVVAFAVSLAQRYNLKAADAIIAASALLTQRALVSADSHFQRVAGLAVLAPGLL